MQTLTQAEIDERVSILKRFRSLLEQQRAKFAEYLHVLELQENKISEEDTEALLAHSELETEIVSNIASLQKVIVPMQGLYEKARNYYDPKEAIPVESIQNDLEKLQKKVLDQNEKNRSLLKVHLSQLRTQVANYQNPYRNAASVYTKQASTGSRIAIDI